MPLYASTDPFVDGICLPLQVQLVDLWKEKTPANQRTEIEQGLIYALTDPINTNATEVLSIDPGNMGNINSVVVKYRQRKPKGRSTASYNVNCDPEISRKPLQTVVTIENHLRSESEEIDTGELRKLCSKEGNRWLVDSISNSIDGFVSDLNLALWQLLLPQVGPWRDGSASKTFTLLNADGSSRMHGEAQMIQELKRAGVNGTPIVVAEGNAALYAWNQSVGTAQDTGFLVNSSAKYRLFPDYSVSDASVFNDVNKGLILMPGAVQLLTWNANVGDYAARVPGFYEHTTVTDPKTGLKFDLELRYAPCGKKWTYEISTHYNLFTLPLDAFDTGDSYEGMNFAFAFEADQAP